MTKPLTVAVQMDPLAGINIAGDSSFALMLSAQARGHRLFHYAAEDLNWSGGRLWTRAHPVTVQRVAGDQSAGTTNRTTAYGGFVPRKPGVANAAGGR